VLTVEVTGSNGASLAGAPVQLIGHNESEDKSGLTNPEGECRFTDLELGAYYDVQASAKRFLPRTLDDRVLASGDRTGRQDWTFPEFQR
jgi:hypothetical protein